MHPDLKLPDENGPWLALSLLAVYHAVAACQTRLRTKVYLAFEVFLGEELAKRQRVLRSRICHVESDNDNC
eukprot:786467-Pleurochrysis_carterae.AAC.1